MLPQDTKVEIRRMRRFAICSLRYALHRRTYFAKTISNAILALDSAVFNKRVVRVMLTDIERYYETRKMLNRPIDDDCAKQAWDRLYTFLEEKEKELNK